jgi:ribosomal-protein-alanine acetyltransferase
MRVRAARIDDIPRLIALERQADTAAHWGEQHYQALFVAEPPAENACSTTEKRLPGAKRLCLVVEIPSGPRVDVEGQADCGVSVDENRPATPQSPVMGFAVARCAAEEWEIENLVVDAGSRRRGLASRLLQQLLAHALDRGAKTMVLEVRESNQAARALYAKWGFREAGRRKSYYRDPEEAAILLVLAGGGGSVKNG